ncbi:MAG: hypothetical protein K2J74_06810, partial [Muribaculaceae bacterium]|nr:hypothetical protein [Muribaculaceae bacterium]
MLEQASNLSSQVIENPFIYAKSIAELENAISVVSDMRNKKSHIYTGKFAQILGIEDYNIESSIWESRIISLMSGEEQEKKIVTELQFYNFISSQPTNNRKNYYLICKLNFHLSNGTIINVLHRMYYLYDGGQIRYAICVY